MKANGRSSRGSNNDSNNNISFNDFIAKYSIRKMLQKISLKKKHLDKEPNLDQEGTPS